MRILHLLPQLSCGGAELLAGRIALWQCRAGHQVQLVTMHPPAPDFQHYPYREALANELPPVITSARWRLNPLHFRSRLEWKALLESFKPDIVHSHLFEADFLALSHLRNETAYCCHVHGPVPPPTSWPATLFRKLESTLLHHQYQKGKAWFIAISQAMAQYAASFLSQSCRQRIRVVYNAIDIERFPFRHRRQPEIPLRLVTTGNLIPRKQHDFLIDVVHILSQQGIACSLKVLGGGPLQASLQDRVNRLGLAQAVTLMGSVKAVETFLNEADLYLHAAQPEPLGLAVLEAMACGLPAVVLDGGGVSELMVNGVNGLLVPRRHAGEFARAILQLTQDPEVYAACSLGARRTAEAHDMDSYLQKLMAVYSSALAERRRASA